MKRMLIAMALLVSGCAAIPTTPEAVFKIPDPPVLSAAARKDPKLAYTELVEKYKELRTFTKESQDRKPQLVDDCPVKIGSVSLPMFLLGEIHLVLFTYCRPPQLR